MLSVKLYGDYKRTLKRDPKTSPCIAFVLKLLTILTKVKIFAKIGLFFAQ